MNKMVYEKPKAEIVQFDNSDVVTTSGGSDGQKRQECRENILTGIVHGLICVASRNGIVDATTYGGWDEPNDNIWGGSSSGDDIW